MIKRELTEKDLTHYLIVLNHWQIQTNGMIWKARINLSKSLTRIKDWVKETLRNLKQEMSVEV